ncbi:uncharacterized protein FIBRA_06275 [Fibroporia radiculosa]|uniref:L-ornithine N(5)-monooxygenase [NAD(P)H] n=1 Tax=Fibroporia radiculosa TaxID=599839 RepID=J4GSG4_9APHY|nr:uncharacterized protein FIBRA_06275 [Fibroporia radiculosa]CCM04115.1 predicted protein [Fibroporia radiculosa]
MPMPLPRYGGGALSGDDMCAYMENFAARFLGDKIRYCTEILKVHHATAPDSGHPAARKWLVYVQDTNSGIRETLEYDKVVLCSGGCSEPRVPPSLSEKAADARGFNGPVVHSADFCERLDEILNAVKPVSEYADASVVVIGGGKSAQDTTWKKSINGTIFTYHMDRKQDCSRSVGLLDLVVSACLDSIVVGEFGTNVVGRIQFRTLGVPSDSPLRRTPGLLWAIHVNNLGVHSDFHAEINKGMIDLISPVHAECFADDRQGIILTDGRFVKADAVVLATGYGSSWDKLFDEETMEELGFSKEPDTYENDREWKYMSLANPPAIRPGEQRSYPMYRGLVPAKSILNRDIAMSGTVFTTNNGYSYEVASHWIASYLRGDKFLKLPDTPEAALAWSRDNAAWLRKRHPHALLSANASFSGDFAFWCWPQLMDTLLDDMSLPSMRSGGNVFTWPFKVIDLKEIEDLGRERAVLRESL